MVSYNLARMLKIKNGRQLAFVEQPIPMARPKRYRKFLEVAKHEALFACDLYNQRRQPRTLEAFVVHMAMAWLHLFHAMYECDGIDCRYWRDGRVVRVDGEAKAWDLSRCIEHSVSNGADPIRRNVEFFVGLRNKIEHRLSPSQLRDLEFVVAGKAQAYMLNFESLLVREFGVAESLSHHLRFPILLSSLTTEAVEGMKTVYKRIPARTRAFIEAFDAATPDETKADAAYDFKVYMIPKTSSAAQADLAVEFVRLDDLSGEARANVEHATVLIRDRHVQVANLRGLKPSDVVKQVRHVWPGFNIHHHQLAWLHFKARPRGKSDDPTLTDARYCVYDHAHRDYVFTEAWAAKLCRAVQEDPEAAIAKWKALPAKRTN